jgi:hypothetical protein
MYDPRAQNVAALLSSRRLLRLNIIFASAYALMVTAGVVLSALLFMNKSNNKGPIHRS